MYLNECKVYGGIIMLNYGVKMKKLLLVVVIIVSVLSMESMMNYYVVKVKVKKVEY